MHDDTTQLWNRSGVVSTRTQALTEAAQKLDPEAIVWRGDVIHAEGGSLSAGLAGHPRCDHATSSPSTRGTSMQHVLGDVVNLPFSRGALGLRSAILTANAAY